MLPLERIKRSCIEGPLPLARQETAPRADRNKFTRMAQGSSRGPKGTSLDLFNGYAVLEILSCHRIYPLRMQHIRRASLLPLPRLQLRFGRQYLSVGSISIFQSPFSFVYSHPVW